jgi:uncharacterized phage-like protein YoqJ
MSIVICGTGHRPQKIGGFITPNKIFNFVCKSTEQILLKEKPDKIITGMALGFDCWLAQISYKLKIPFIAAVPFKGQESKWPNESQKLYTKLLGLASEIFIVSPGEYSAEKMQIRNEWMVNNSNKVIAAWNGSPGGTGNCVKYARSIGKEIIRINPDDANS